MLADIDFVREQMPLPETAFELCETARRLGVPHDEVLLGRAFTETAVKDLSDTGRLAHYRIVHFATHGALAGEVKGTVEEHDATDDPDLAAAGRSVSEPGLILTPPPKGTLDADLLDRDDGYLTASEISTLKLDADWVVLSACNTAGASGESGEALSGLARSFFYAGARTLLASHWPVGSHAAIKLTTRAFEAINADPAIGRAEALRRSMRDLALGGDAVDAHPTEWAPFVLVGEGAR